MKLVPLLLSAILIAGSGFTGNAIAHGGGHGHGKPYYGYYDTYRHRRPYRHFKRHHRGWHRGHAKRHHHRPKRDLHDSWYGIHLFFGGH